MAELDNLSIKIEADSTTAAENINSLVTSLNNLRTAANGGAGLNPVVKRLQDLSAAAGDIGTDTEEKIRGLASALDSLQSVQKASGLNSVANTLNKFNTVDVSGISARKMRSLASALNNLEGVQKAGGFTSTISALKKIPDIINSLDTTNLEQFKDQMIEVADAVRPLATEMEKVASGFSAFPAKIQSLLQSNNALANSNEIVGDTFKKLNKVLSSAKVRFGVLLAVFRRVSNTMGQWVESANSYIESTNLFSVSMWNYYDEALKYVNLVNEKLGVDPKQWMDAQGTFMLMAKGFGIAEDKAYALSKGLTELSYDISSLKNIQPEEAALKLRSMLAGEIEPIRGYGLTISQATLQEYALSKGITENVNAMTEQERALLRSVKVLEDATRVGYVGDFIKTLESPANAMRILQQQVTQLGRALGTVFLPIIVQIIPWVRLRLWLQHRLRLLIELL